MRWIVISPEGERADEATLANQLVGLGMVRYHVRKPSWPKEQLRRFLKTLALPLQTRCVLHSHHELLDELALLGRHWKDDGSAPALLGPGFTSRSCHDPETLIASLGRFSSLFFSPVFSSLSKPGYGEGRTLGAVPSLLGARNETERRTEVIALGGITPDRAIECKALGFDGVATLGWVWQAPDPLAAFAALTAPFSSAHGA